MNSSKLTLVALLALAPACTTGGKAQQLDGRIGSDGQVVQQDGGGFDEQGVTDGKIVPPVPDAYQPPPKWDSGQAKWDAGPPPPDSSVPTDIGPPPPPGDIKVAAVQYGPASYTYVPGCTDTNCGLIHFVKEAAQNGATWIVTPEAVPDQGQYAILDPPIGQNPIGHPNWKGTILETWAKLAVSVKANLVFNVITQVGSGTTADLYSTELALSTSGVVIGKHYKYHPYGEPSLTAGTSCVDKVATPAGDAGMLICADVQCVFCLTTGVSCSSCISIDKTCLPQYQAAGLHITFFSSYWMATGSSNPVWKATTMQSIFAKYSGTYMVAANTIAGSSTQYHGGGVFKPDGTAIQIYDSTKPGIAYGVIPKQGTPPPPPPPAGDVVITEFMANPKAVADTSGEWIELYNAGTTSVDLNGWTLKDAGSNSHTINKSGGFSVAPGKYVVLGVNDTTSTNGGVPVDYKLSSFSLTNSGDQILLYDSSSQLVDKVEYTSSWGVPDGASLSLKSTSADNNISANWCQETSAWSGSAGDKGTPGAPSGC